ncbi:1-phosphofructokinase family hexose kinase [Nesterenkonia muleiensis]|uniref:1-phosphofructokinase family hexose kinase n=1 Tax=Nesterenkonia muleiensis TaxID=2282648 RepID=UPI000E71C963|nr:hexose kinase [Nesterenkonia muleiensis]
MIITVTPNPSLDSTVELPSPLLPGQVHRAVTGHTDPGGKGVNISRALTAAKLPTVAVIPSEADDPLLLSLNSFAVPYQTVPLGAAVRTNITITDPTGVTTKINEPGPELDADRQQALITAAASVPDTTWAALAGSLPPGTDPQLYTRLISALRSSHPQAKIAVDSSGQALASTAAAEPDLIKPNADELLELHTLLTGRRTDTTPGQLEQNRSAVVELVRAVQPYGVRTALVTLGAHGAVLVPAEPKADVLMGFGPPIVARSTVGAGDAALAGYISAADQGASPAERLRHAMAHGRAAASLPGSQMPSPEDLEPHTVTVEPLTCQSPEESEDQ